MGKYTSNDNKSMQCNPNNERYWSSRGYDDDYYDDEHSSNYDIVSESKIIDAKRKDVIDEISFSYSGKKIIFKESGRIIAHDRKIFDPIVENFDYLSENILKEKLIFKKDLNITRSNLRRFLLNNVPSKNFEMTCNWFMRNIVEEDGGCYWRYEYLLLEMFESENYVIFLFKDYLQGSKSIPCHESSQRWMFRDFKSGEFSDKANNIVEDLSKVFETGD
tara:strand:- start:2631 stop:3287 length:657 start_codon:yes stop_codon:yes gene_type:complete